MGLFCFFCLLFSEDGLVRGGQEAKQAGAAERRRLSLSPRKPARKAASPRKSTAPAFLGAEAGPSFLGAEAGAEEEPAAGEVPTAGSPVEEGEWVHVE